MIEVSVNTGKFALLFNNQESTMTCGYWVPVESLNYKIFYQSDFWSVKLRKSLQSNLWTCTRMLKYRVFKH